jgi:hypothetical protein
MLSHFAACHGDLLSQLPDEVWLGKVCSDDSVLALVDKVYDGAKRAMGGKKRPRSASLAEIELTSKMRSSLPGVDLLPKLQAVAALVESGAPFSTLDNPSYRMQCADLSHSRVKLAPTRREAARLLDVLYACCLDQMKTKLRTADGFSVSFDLWPSTTIARSLLSITYHFLSPDLELHSLVLDAIPMPPYPTVRAIATALADRVERRRPLFTPLFSDERDSARDVVQAAKAIEGELEGAVRDAVERERADEEADDEAAPLADCLVNRTLNQLVLGALGECNEAADLIRRIRTIVQSVRRSRKREQLLCEHAERLCSAGPPFHTQLNLPLTTDLATRWTTTLTMLRTFVQMYHPLLLLLNDRWFRKESGVHLQMVEEQELTRVQELIRLLTCVEDASPLHQGASVLSLPHVQASFSHMSDELSSFQTACSTGLAVRRHLRQGIAERSAPFFHPQHLCSLAALLHPVHCGETRSVERLQCTLSKLTECLSEVVEVEAGSASDDDSLLDLVEKVDRETGRRREVERLVWVVRRAVRRARRRHVQSGEGPEEGALVDTAYPFRPRTYQRMTDDCLAFYRRMWRSGYVTEIQMRLVRRVFSSTLASSAAAPRSHCAVSPLRNRLTGETGERAAVVSAFLGRQSGGDADRFWEQLADPRSFTLSGVLHDLT